MKYWMKELRRLLIFSKVILVTEKEIRKRNVCNKYANLFKCAHEEKTNFISKQQTKIKPSDKKQHE